MATTFGADVEAVDEVVDAGDSFDDFFVLAPPVAIVEPEDFLEADAEPDSAAAAAAGI